MTSLRGTGARRRRGLFGDRGAAAVEAAIVTPLVMGLFFGIVELGFVFKDYLAVTGAVRAGVRMASANPRVSTFAQDAANQVAQTGGAMNFTDVKQLWVYKVDTTTNKPIGFTDFSNCTVCVKFNWNNTTNAFEPVIGGSAPTWPSNTQNACSSSGPGGPPDRVGVYLLLNHRSFTKFVFNTVNLSDASMLTLEPIPLLTGCK